MCNKDIKNKALLILALSDLPKEKVIVCNFYMFFCLKIALSKRNEWLLKETRICFPPFTEPLDLYQCFPTSPAGTP